MRVATHREIGSSACVALARRCRPNQLSDSGARNIERLQSSCILIRQSRAMRVRLGRLD